MLTQTYLGIPIYALVAAGAAILAVIAFAIYIFLLKRRVAVFSQKFDAAIDEFNAGCNPGHSMTDEELGLDKLSTLIGIKYHTIADAKTQLNMDSLQIREFFLNLQHELYNGSAVKTASA